MAQVRPAFPTAFILGMGLSFSSVTAAAIGVGSARDSTDVGNVSISSPLTGSITSTGANGLDVKSLTGTVATNAASTSVTGTGTAFLTEFAPNNTPRTLTGTIGTGGAASTTITGSSTLFLTQVSVGDLIGNATVGYARVTAIASNTSLTVVSNLTITNGSTGLVLENVTFRAASQTAQRVNSISSNTALVLPAVSSATQSGVAATTGVEVASCWYTMSIIWAPSASVTPAAYISTQRTSFYAFPSTYTLKRRTGWILNNSSGDLALFTPSYYNSNTMQVDWNFVVAATVSSGAATTWTGFTCEALAPASTTVLNVLLYDFQPTVAQELSVRARNSGASGAETGSVMASTAAIAAQRGLWIGLCPCDGAQGAEYIMSAAPGNTPAFIRCAGYLDDRTLFM